jgi:rubrerythrin
MSYMDMLEFAIKMEQDGEKYYETQAALHQADGLKVVFTMLAGEERKHAGILRNKQNGAPYTLDKPERPDLKSVFSGLASLQGDLKPAPDQLDAYRMALDMEQRSIDLYMKMLAEPGSDRKLCEFLIKQEQGHYAIIEELVKLVSRPAEWVEAAEFGIREEY